MIKNGILTGHRAVEAGSHQACAGDQSRMKTEIPINGHRDCRAGPDGRCSSMGPGSWLATGSRMHAEVRLKS